MQAVERSQAYVNADHVHVRSGPGTDHYATEVLGGSDPVDVLETGADGWCRIRPPQGSFSWIAAEAIAVRRDGTARLVRDREQVRIGSRVRDAARSAAESRFDPRRHAVQVTLRRGDVVELLDQRPRRGTASGTSWYKIAPPPGEVRWIHGQYLSRDARPLDESLPGAATASNAVIAAQYAAPAPTAPPIAAPTLGPPIEPAYPAIPAGPVAGPPYLVPMIGPLTRHYVSLDALGWWVKGDSLPPLVSTSPIGTPQADAGVLGLPTTSILYGNGPVNDTIRPGGRVQGGVWIDPVQTIALEGHYYALATQTASFSRTSTFSDGSLDDSILARPFFNIAPGIDAEDAILVAFPDFVVPPAVDIDGTIEVQEYSRIQSSGGGARYSLSPAGMPAKVFLVGGYRFFRLAEGLSIVASSSPGTDPFPIPFPPGRVEAVDSFTTRNTFNGGEVGLGLELGRTRWSLGAETRLAMGNMHQTLAIDGRTSAISGGYIASFPGGLLAQPTNIGSYAQNRFSLIPQVDVKLGYQLLRSMRVTVGYNFTYITNVLRPGGQVDTTVNTTQIAGLPLVGPASPEATLDNTSIWLQGITGGLDFRF